MLASDRFPDFTFIDEAGGEKVLQLREAGGRIRAVAAKIRRAAPAGSSVGLIYPSSPELVVNWLACLVAETCPLVMQYPTRKQSREYWAASVSNTIREARLALVLADDRSVQLGLREFVPTLAQGDLEVDCGGPNDPFRLGDFSIVQLSSGTTGHRKAVRFHSEQLERHVRDYNHTLELDERDTIVSWLPLYHDMGYIACFVMPLYVGSRVVMMDPMTWIKEPALLNDAIERHGGSVCYMPNFGFEVMSRQTFRNPSRVRWWIACSEPVSSHTARKFIEVSGAAPDSFAPCYAMAENVFAVTLRRGLQTRQIGRAEVVSCGKPVEGVDVKVIDGEIWVRSPTSLQSYMNGSDIRDPEGFYPTGDLGELHGGELYVTGRKQDMMIQAGVKYMLSDVDLALNEMYPDIRGRAAALALREERLGTESLLVLIESAAFWRRSDQAEMAEALKRRLGIDQIRIEFVPPRFLTKTSSGKVNRNKTAEDWLRRERVALAPRHKSEDAVAELRDAFPRVPWDQPVRGILDSLSLTVLRTILGETWLAYDGRLTLEQITEKLTQSRTPGSDGVRNTIRIVSLADKRILQRVRGQHLERLGCLLGAEVTMEHLCLPPSAVLLSDLIFLDYFAPRLEKDDFAAVAAAARKLREASVILFDDVAEMYFPPNQVYGALSHNLERDPRTDLISVRWQRYARLHDRLPLTLVSGADLPLEHCSDSLRGLGEYLGKPIFRIATIKGFEPFTADWEYRPLHGVSGVLEGLGILEPDDFVDKLAGWIGRSPTLLDRWPRHTGPTLEMAELAHYCSHISKQDLIDRVLVRYDRFCIVGQPSSVPYLRAALQRLGKKFVQARSYAPENLRQFEGQFDCLLICGSQGNYRIEVPAAAIMSVGGAAVRNIEHPALAIKSFTTSKNESPASGTDWYYPHQLDRRRNARQFRAVRIDATKKAKEENRERRRDLLREARAARRAALESMDE
jgi:acyl-CoA synthetase (AMP-forming)/AMP-acid ligase II